MPRQLTAILLFLSFAAQVFNQNIVVLDFYRNRAIFAKACENKARPMMHCNGKCQLMKKLKEEEKKNQQNPTRKSENRDEVVYCQAMPVTPKLFAAPLLSCFSSCADTYFPPGNCTDIFHPPALA